MGIESVASGGPLLPPDQRGQAGGRDEEIRCFAASILHREVTLELLGRDCALAAKQIVDRTHASKEMFKGLSLLVEKIAQADLDPLYQRVEELFRAREFLETTEAWVQRADLLDAIDAIVLRSQGRLAYLRVGSRKHEYREGAVPLIPYTALRDAVQEAGGSRFAALEQMQSLPLLYEYTSTTKMVEQATRRHQRGVLGTILRFFSRLLTWLLGFIYRVDFRLQKLQRIASFSLGMGITPFEAVRVFRAEEGGQVEEYRGPRFLFGLSVHGFRTINQWFARDLTSAARALYVSKAMRKEESLTLKYGMPSEGASRVVVANADARLRFHSIRAAHLGDPLELTGKVLSQEAAAEAERRGDDPTYYHERYKFSARNLFGREANDPMLISSLPTEGVPVREAQHELLAAIYRALDRQDLWMVIQRLAPEDVHNYVTPLDGTPLSHREAALFLREQAGHGERNHLEALARVFEQQEEMLGRPSQATIDIYGTLDPVAAPAIANRSSILAQNDRKIMLLRHPDGTYSVHVFIGATGVGRVDVDPSTELKRLGERQGDMQFGSDIYAAQGGYGSARAHMTRDQLAKLRLGEWGGSFPLTGSTVISIYSGKDFTPYPKVREAEGALAYGERHERRQLEINAQMGDPILVSTEISIAEELEERFPEDFLSLTSSDDVPADAAEQILKKLGRRQIDPDLRKRVLNVLNQRLQTIRTYRELLGGASGLAAEAASEAIDRFCFALSQEDSLGVTPEIQAIQQLLRKQPPLSLHEQFQLTKFRKILADLLIHRS